MNPSTQVPQQQTVIVKKVVQVKKKRSLVGLLSGTIFILSLFIVLGAFFSLALWVHTFNVFTQKKVIAEIQVSEKYFRDGKPTFKVKYIPKDDESGFFGLIKPDTSDEIVELEMTGDQIFIDTDFVQWKDWLTFINFKPVYKVSRLKTGFQKSEDYNNFKVQVLDINEGPDPFVAKLRNYPEKYTWLAQSVYIPSPGTDIQNQSRTYELVATEDSITIRPKL
jgi:hypothetical protein